MKNKLMAFWSFGENHIEKNSDIFIKDSSSYGPMVLWSSPKYSQTHTHIQTNGISLWMDRIRSRGLPNQPLLCWIFNCLFKKIIKAKLMVFWSFWEKYIEKKSPQKSWKINLWSSGLLEKSVLKKIPTYSIKDSSSYGPMVLSKIQPNTHTHTNKQDIPMNG